jgi:N-acetylmuramate 1-kinase
MPGSISTQENLFLNEPWFQAAEAHLQKHLTGSLQWEPITHGGSDRDFFRVRSDSGKSLILMRYSDSREENALYAEIARFLTGIQVHVPQLIFNDSASRLIGLEDLGELSLHAFFYQNSGSEKVVDFYKTALDQARLLHQHSSTTVPTMNGFDEKLYHWERNYFFDNLVERWGKIQLSETERSAFDREGHQLSVELMAVPRCLIHRDFQSQNLIVCNGTIWLIDFQGMRLGHAVYDVASLLYDPYVPLKPSLRKTLLRQYAESAKADVSAFEMQFYRAAVQRLMQALGAYGFLGLVKGKREFLTHIPQGLENLKDALENLGNMPKTLNLVSDKLLKNCGA